MILDPQNTPTQDIYRHLTDAVAPRPICFASTIDAAGNVNLSPYSFFNVFSSNPPLLVFSPVRRGRDGSAKDTLNNVLATREVVVNIVNYPIVEQMSLTSTEYAADTNEFVKAGLTQVASERVRPPRVLESPVSFECTVERVLPLGEGGGAGNLVLARVVLVHLNDAYLGADGRLDNRKLDLVARMGGNDYLRAIPEALFSVPKPLRTRGIGVDGLPAHVRNSDVLTGNDLGRLGNVERLPTPEEIAEMDFVVPTELSAAHRMAREYLRRNERWEALGLLVGFQS